MQTTGTLSAAFDPVTCFVTTALVILVFKLAVLGAGVFIARLGYGLLVQGITGQFKFKAKLGDRTADLASASPGIFFIAMATTLMAVAVVVDKPFGVSLRASEPAPDQLPSAQCAAAPALPSAESLELENEL